MPQVTPEQASAFKYISDRDHHDLFRNAGVDYASDLTVAKVQKVINSYCDEQGGYLFNPFASQGEHFDFAYDMGVVMTLLGGQNGR